MRWRHTTTAAHTYTKQLNITYRWRSQRLIRLRGFSFSFLISLYRPIKILDLSFEWFVFVFGESLPTVLLHECHVFEWIEWCLASLPLLMMISCLLPPLSSCRMCDGCRLIIDDDENVKIIGKKGRERRASQSTHTYLTQQESSCFHSRVDHYTKFSLLFIAQIHILSSSMAASEAYALEHPHAQT